MDEGLKAFRKQIDEVDRQVVHLLSRRQLLCDAAAELKPAGHDPRDMEREVQVLVRIEALAASSGLDARLAREVWHAILAVSVARQRRLLNWNGNGVSLASAAKAET
ncbi:chorismate mutase [Glycocaulis sp.]